MNGIRSIICDGYWPHCNSILIITLGGVLILIEKKYCPHCKTLYNFENSSPGVSKTTKYGSPLITCKNCRKEFWDTGIVEIAVSGINKDDTRKIRIKTVISALTAMVCVIVMGLLIGKTDYAQNIIVFVCLGIALFALCIISDLATYKKRCHALKVEEYLSDKRLQNYEYALKLKLKGYPVPEKYLTNNN